MDKVLDKLLNGSVDLGLKLIVFLLILIIGFRIVKILIKLINKGKGFNKLEKSVQTFIVSFINILLKCLVLITGLAYLGIPMTSLITLFGTASLAVGLALQGGLTNMVGGLMILIFKPFKVGDYVDTHVDSGTVSEISIFYTTLVTPDNKSIVLPNGNLANSAIVNYSHFEKRRLDIDFSVSYNSDVDKVKKVILEVINSEEKILKNEDIFVRLTSHADSALVFSTRVWVKNEDYWNVKFNMLENVKIAFDKNKIEIPYPQLDVHMDK